MPRDLAQAAQELQDHLSLASPPLAIAFTQDVPDGVARFEAPFAEPASDGRTGRVSAGCVFWMHAAEGTFATVPEDHGNCSVGSYTHGLISLEEAASKDDTKALLECGWVDQESVQGVPAVQATPGAVVYGPLKDAPVDPDVVFLRVTGKQAMFLKDALPHMLSEGKPQCHIIAIAKEQQQPAMSVGCMVSRVRTGMPSNEMTVAIPAAKLEETLDALAAAQQADRAVAQYAAEDKRRFQAG